MDRLIYLYGLIPTEEAAMTAFPNLKGFDGDGTIYTVPCQNITAIVSDLDPESFSEDSIREKIEGDVEWLQHKAFHHHETLKEFYGTYTLIPLKFCTIYENEENLVDTVSKNEGELLESFRRLKGNEEWNLKIYCDDEALKAEVRDNNPTIEAKQKEISELSPGRQFFEKKKIEKLVESELDKEKDALCENVHAKLKKYAVSDAVKKNWSKDVTGLKENMAWNSVFLLPVHEVEAFLEQIQQIEQKLSGSGWRFEASGPWPAYHFSSVS